MAYVETVEESNTETLFCEEIHHNNKRKKKHRNVDIIPDKPSDTVDGVLPVIIDDIELDSKINDNGDGFVNKYNLEPESYYGNTEYKLMIKSDNTRKIKLQTQLQFRILQSSDNKCFYWLGIMDDGYALGTTEKIMDITIKNLGDIANAAGARIKVLSKTNIGNYIDNIGVDLSNKFYRDIIGLPCPVDALPDNFITPDRFIASVEVIAYKSQIDYETITVATIGNVDAGKSTLIGTFVLGNNDDGKGKNRTHFVKHKHELVSGHTSSVNHIILGYDETGKCKYYEPGCSRDLISKNAKKVVKFFDLAGHEKYLKTTIQGLTHNRPDYALILVEASKGVTDMTKMHITLCHVRRIPIIILITKVDKVDREKYKETYNNISKLLKTHFQGLIPNPICDDTDDVIRAAEQLKYQYKTAHSEASQVTCGLVPVIDISCVNGEGLSILKKLIYRLTPNYIYKHNEKTEFYIENIYENIMGVGLVVSGLLTSGTVMVGDMVNIGPNATGDFMNIKIKSIHVDHIPMEYVKAGHHCSFSIAHVKKKGNIDTHMKDFITKDMVIIDDMLQPVSYKLFEISMKMLNIEKITKTKLKKISLGVGSNFIIQVNNIRRSVTIKSIKSINKIAYETISTSESQKRHYNENRIRPNDRAVITVELDSPAYLKTGDMCILTESHMFGIGMIKDIR
jgi:elongation factor 1-alpha